MNTTTLKTIHDDLFIALSNATKAYTEYLKVLEEQAEAAEDNLQDIAELWDNDQCTEAEYNEAQQAMRNANYRVEAMEDVLEALAKLDENHDYALGYAQY